MYHFPDDTSFLQIDKWYKKIQHNLIYDLKCLCNWLLANKISLNTAKTELIFFRNPSEKIPTNIKIKINGQKLYHTTHIKFLDWSAHCIELQPRLRLTIGMLAKTKYYLNQNELISLYHATFSSSVLYGSQVRGHTTMKHLRKVEVLQNVTLRIILNHYGHVSPHYKALNILILKDNIKLKNCLLHHDFINNKLPSSFNN